MPNQTTTPATPSTKPASTPPPTIAQCRAKRALSLPDAMLKRLLRSWAEGLDAVWTAPDPAAVLAAMGTQAGALFARSAQLRAFLEAQQPGCTAIPQAARIKPHTVNADGTVTLVGAAAVK
jgi:hypothetical protein